MLKFFALSRFLKNFFCKISKALKQIVPTNVANKNTCCARCNQTLFLACLYESTGRAIAVTMASVLASALPKMLKFLVKIFKSLHLLNPWMDLVDSVPDIRY